MSKNNLIIVSNRLPVSVEKKNGKLVFHVSTGGLATAMSSLDMGDNKIWIGWPGIASDDITAAEKTQITKELKKYNCFPVYLTHAQVQNFYEGYSNDTLWPLFHYFQSLTKHNDVYWRAYKEVNKIFLRAVAACAGPESMIWVQDYHLMLLPAHIRKSIPRSKVGFFLHIPFPSFEIFRLLPKRKEILEGLLGSDIIGFHVYDYARHFLSSCLRLLDLPSKNGNIFYEGRTVKVDAYPIGIDYKKFRDTLKKPETKTSISTLRDTYMGQKIILSVDRLDYSKGIPERLEAYNIFLSENPHYIGKVKLVMVAVPSRTEVETYKNLRDQIEQAVSRINGTHGTIDWAPISYQFQNLPFEKIVALYNASHIALVTPLRDGMNLVAKEYVASKTARSPGVLVLSEMAGAIDELSEAVRINPNDTSAVAGAIRQALEMPKNERLSRQKSMQGRIEDYTVQKWGQVFIDDLSGAGKKQSTGYGRKASPDVKKTIVSDFVSAKKRLLLLDYDGTVQSFKSSPRPSAAKPGRALMSMLMRLSSLPNTDVYIVSGRKKRALESWFGNTNLSLVAEHGAWIKQNNEWRQNASDFSDIKKRVLPLLHKYTSRTAGSIIEEKDFAYVWHYRNVPIELSYVRVSELKRELKAELAGTDVTINSGHKIIEVKPRSINKGAVVEEIVADYKDCFVLCAGDDYTDEDMFNALPETANTIKVGPGDTAALYTIPTVEEMIKLLDELSKKLVG